MATRHIKATIACKGPVHIGNGERYGKKDYFAIGNDSVGVLDARRFVAGLGPEDLERYCRFLETDSRSSLEDFLKGGPELAALANKCVAYRVDMTLARARRGTRQYFDVAQFVKGADGMPYVPGSSVKGMLRTALLAHVVAADRGTYLPLFDEAVSHGRPGKDACRAIERRALWVEHLNPEDFSDASDIMRYVSVSDSEPLSTSDLVFVKKYDKFSKGDDADHKLAMGKISNEAEFFEGNALNIYRECLRPGTEATVTIDVDERIDAYLVGLTLDADGIKGVLEEAFALYERSFLDRFSLDGVMGLGGSGAGSDDGQCRYVYQGGPLAGRRCRNRAVGNTGYCNTHQSQAGAAVEPVGCYLGGGVDFDGKTVVNALLDGDRRRVGETSSILYGQFPTKRDPSARDYSALDRDVRDAGFEPGYMHAKYDRKGKLTKGKDDHRHWKDVELGVSPHTVKLGIIGNKKYLMGRCSVALKEA